MEQTTTDINPNHPLVRVLPSSWWPYAALVRLDRPIGFYLAFLPALMGLNAAFLYLPKAERSFSEWFFLFTILFFGAWIMRSAGCIWNDFLDRDLDAQVTRSRMRPIAAGQVSLRAALLVMTFLLILAVNLLWLLPGDVFWVALVILPFVLIYPLMKRFFDAPQLWLGLTFNAGIWVAWISVHGPTHFFPPFLLYLGCIFWTLAYDTVYALQDCVDDRKSGIKSLALALGKYARPGIIMGYFLCFLCWFSLIIDTVYYNYYNSIQGVLGIMLGIVTFLFYAGSVVYIFKCSCVWLSRAVEEENTEKKTSHHGKFFRENAFFGLLVSVGLFSQIWIA